MKTRSINIYTVLTIIWIITIFFFSLQPAETSSEMSSGFLRRMIEIFLPSLLEKYKAMMEAQLLCLHFVFRKCAHFAEFFILGVFVLMSERYTEIRHKALVGIAICMLVASMDETIQLFVSGRSGKVIDVLLDTLGASIGCFAVSKFLRLRNRF